MNYVYDNNFYRFIGVMGDLHNDYHAITNFIFRQRITDICLINVGDFPRGLGLPEDLIEEEERLAKLNEYLVEYNSMVYVIRGNHDNPAYYDGEHDFSNIKFLPDYTILQIENKNILCIGGAISIDRKTNIKDVSWFENEGVVINKDEVKDITDLDMMITHTSPNYVYPFWSSHIVDNAALLDPTLKMDLEIERKELGEFVDFILARNPNLKQYFYGHFHKYNVTYKGHTKFTCLGIQEIRTLI